MGEGEESFALRVDPPPSRRPSPFGSPANIEVAFESESFNRRFVVDTTDVEEAHRVIDARLMDALMQMQAGLSVELGRSGVAVFGTGIVAVDQIPTMFATAWDLVGKLPTSAVRYFDGRV